MMRESAGARVGREGGRSRFGLRWLVALGALTVCGGGSVVATTSVAEAGSAATEGGPSTWSYPEDLEARAKAAGMTELRCRLREDAGLIRASCAGVLGEDTAELTVMETHEKEAAVAEVEGSRKEGWSRRDDLFVYSVRVQDKLRARQVVDALFTIDGAGPPEPAVIRKALAGQDGVGRASCNKLDDGGRLRSCTAKGPYGVIYISWSSHSEASSREVFWGGGTYSVQDGIRSVTAEALSAARARTLAGAVFGNE